MDANDDQPSALPPPALPVEQPAAMLDQLTQLERVLSQPPAVPDLGKAASAAVQKCFEQVASEMERLVQERVDHALQVQQDFQSYAAILRQSGTLLCQKIEDEAVRTRHLHEVLALVRDRLSEPVLEPFKPEALKTPG